MSAACGIEVLRNWSVQSFFFLCFSKLKNFAHSSFSILLLYDRPCGIVTKGKKKKKRVCIQDFISHGAVGSSPLAHEVLEVGLPWVRHRVLNRHKRVGHLTDITAAGELVRGRIHLRPGFSGFSGFAAGRKQLYAHRHNVSLLSKVPTNISGADGRAYGILETTGAG